ncbi:MAG: aspartyl protease family protein [Acidobacteriaceae bacterium]
MVRVFWVGLGIAFGVWVSGGMQASATQPEGGARRVATILAQVREATGGEAWARVAEIRTEGTLQVGGTMGTIAAVVDLRTGANADRVYMDGNRLEAQADMPVEDWEQDDNGDVELTPGGKKPAEIDDLYIHRYGWWEPKFGGAAMTLLAPATESGVTYDVVQCKVPGGSGFALWIDRGEHHIDRIVSGGGVKRFSDFRKTEGGLTLPFEERKGTGAGAVVLHLASVRVLGRVDAVDFRAPFRTDYSMPASGEVTVPAEGGLTFKMKINGRGPYLTIFDTGGLNIVSATFAKQLGLTVKAQPVHFGAIGGAITVHTAHVDSVEIGDLTVRDQTFYVLDIPVGSNEPEMVVGWEMMRRFAVRVDFKRGRLTFFDGPRFHYRGGGEALPLIMHKDNNGIEVLAYADGVPGMFTIDTGNQIGLFLNSGFVHAHDLVHALGATFHGYNGKGFGGPSPEAWFARLPTLRMGEITVDDPVVRLQTASDGMGANAGNIGQSILNRFVVTVDCMRGVMYLEKTPGWDRREAFNRAGLVLDFEDGGDNVMTVLPGSSGEAAGLKVGDRITAIDGKTPADDPNDPAFTQPVGTVLHLTVSRGGVVRAFDVTLKDVL